MVTDIGSDPHQSYGFEINITHFDTSGKVFPRCFLKVMASSHKSSSDMIIVSDGTRSVLEVGCGDGWFTRLLGKDGQHPPLIIASVNSFGEEN